MRDRNAGGVELHHRQITVEELPVHVVEGGPSDAPALLFLHGWPECWVAFARIMELLGRDLRVLAMDLPRIGGSPKPAASADKRSLAGLVHSVALALRVRDLTLVGHDVGGMIAYAYLRAFPGELSRAVIMDVAIPGVEPWPEVVRNPAIWHFAHTEAYARAEALHTGFEWYRAFRRDAEDNARASGSSVDTPELYLRGSEERGLALDRYVDGLRASGLSAVEGRIVAGSGHFAADEQPAAVVELLQEFVTPAFDTPPSRRS